MCVAVKLPGSLGMRKSGTPNPMTAAGKQEHAIVAQTIEEIIGPRLTAEVWSLFFFGSGGGIASTIAYVPPTPSSVTSSYFLTDSQTSLFFSLVDCTESVVIVRVFFESPV